MHSDLQIRHGDCFYMELINVATALTRPEATICLETEEFSCLKKVKGAGGMCLEMQIEKVFNWN